MRCNRRAIVLVVLLAAMPAAAEPEPDWWFEATEGRPRLAPLGPVPDRATAELSLMSAREFARLCDGLGDPPLPCLLVAQGALGAVYSMLAYEEIMGARDPKCGQGITAVQAVRLALVYIDLHPGPMMGWQPAGGVIADAVLEAWRCPGLRQRLPDPR